jgi:uncharacterized protein
MERQSLDASVDVTQLLREPVGSSQSHDVKGTINEDLECFVQGKAKVIHTSQGVLVQCRLMTEVKLTCSRCLDTYLCPINFTAEEEFLQTSGASNDQAVSSLEQTEGFTIDDKNMLDLGELIRQYVLLNLPMKPLCRFDCPGMKEDNSNATTT